MMKNRARDKENEHMRMVGHSEWEYAHVQGDFAMRSIVSHMLRTLKIE